MFHPHRKPRHCMKCTRPLLPPSWTFLPSLLAIITRFKSFLNFKIVAVLKLIFCRSQAYLIWNLCLKLTLLVDYIEAYVYWLQILSEFLYYNKLCFQIRKTYLATKPELNDWFQGISLFDFDRLDRLNWESPKLKKYENITYAVSFIYVQILPSIWIFVLLLC